MEANAEMLEAPDRLMLTILSLLLLPLAISNIAGCESIHLCSQRLKFLSEQQYVGWGTSSSVDFGIGFTERNAWDRVPPAKVREEVATTERKSDKNKTHSNSAICVLLTAKVKPDRILKILNLN